MISSAATLHRDDSVTSPEVTGTSLPPDTFGFLETDVIDAVAIADVLDGKRLGVICRNVVAPRDRTAICENFWRHEGRYTRGSDAPAEYLGTYHYAKPTAVYLEQAQAANAVLPALFEGVINPVAAMKDALSAELARRSRRLRPARHDGLEACTFVPVAGWAVKGVIAASAIEGIGAVIIRHFEQKYPGKTYSERAGLDGLPPKSWWHWRPWNR